MTVSLPPRRSVLGAGAALAIGMSGLCVVLLLVEQTFVAIALGVGGLCVFLGAAIVYLERVIGPTPALRLSPAGLDDPRGIGGFDHLDWAEIEGIKVSSADRGWSGSIVVSVREPHEAFVKFAGVKIPAGKRSVFRLPLLFVHLVNDVEAAAGSFLERSPMG